MSGGHTGRYTNQQTCFHPLANCRVDSHRPEGKLHKIGPTVLMPALPMCGRTHAIFAVSGLSIAGTHARARGSGPVDEFNHDAKVKVTGQWSLTGTL